MSRQLESQDRRSGGTTRSLFAATLSMGGVGLLVWHMATAKRTHTNPVVPSPTIVVAQDTYPLFPRQASAVVTETDDAGATQLSIGEDASVAALENIGRQVLQQQLTAITQATTAAEIRELVLTEIGHAVDNDVDSPPDFHNVCSSGGGPAYINTPSFRRADIATDGTCQELITVVQQWRAANNIRTAVLAAESLYSYCRDLDHGATLDPFAIAIAHQRFDLVTQILEEQLNTAHEEMACHASELVDAGSAPRRYAIEHRLTDFLTRHPGYLARLTWAWTPELLACARQAILRIRFESLADSDEDLAFRASLAPDDAFISTQLALIAH